MDSLFLPLLVGCAVALLSALGVVLARRPIYAAMFLLVHSLSVAAVGHALFGSLLVAFELTAPLLLVAIVGAVVIWRRHEPRSRHAHAIKVSEPRRLVMHR